MDTASNDWLGERAPNRSLGVIEECRNLHAGEEGPKTLTNEIEKMISELSNIPKPDPLLCSLENTVPLHQPARRRPSRARRRDWQKKARYQRSRQPERLRPWQIENLFAANHFAGFIGLPLNTFVTVSWQNTREGNADLQKRFQRAMKAMSQWCRRKNYPATWIFVHENPGNSRPNCHLLVHVPGGHLSSFQEMAQNWFDAVEGGVLIRPRNGPKDRCLYYMVKGTDWVTARCHGARARNQGVIEFKRCGWTQNLGVAARGVGQPARDNNNKNISMKSMGHL
jgi:hypothetical protein